MKASKVLLSVVGIIVLGFLATLAWNRVRALDQENQTLQARVAELEVQLQEVSIKLADLTPANTSTRLDPGGTTPATMDPLAFHRKNPELMKRYFPHLFRQGAAAQPQALEEPDPDAPEPPQPADYDPLEFYRRNPELMRRYFPHLVQGQNVKPTQNAPEPQTTPADRQPPDLPAP